MQSGTGMKRVSFNDHSWTLPITLTCLWNCGAGKWSPSKRGRIFEARRLLTENDAVRLRQQTWRCSTVQALRTFSFGTQTPHVTRGSATQSDLLKPLAPICNICMFCCDSPLTSRYLDLVVFTFRLLRTVLFTESYQMEQNSLWF